MMFLNGNRSEWKWENEIGSKFVFLDEEVISQVFCLKFDQVLRLLDTHITCPKDLSTPKTPNIVITEQTIACVETGGS
jgi:hypothetical protein